MKQFIATLLLVALALGAAGSAAAALGDETIPDIATKGDLITKIETITDFIFVILLFAAVIFIVIGAFQFVTAGGKPESVSEARQKIIWAVVGIVLALFARAIPNVIVDILGTP